MRGTIGNTVFLSENQFLAFFGWKMSFCTLTVKTRFQENAYYTSCPRFWSRYRQSALNHGLPWVYLFSKRRFQPFFLPSQFSVISTFIYPLFIHFVDILYSGSLSRFLFRIVILMTCQIVDFFDHKDMSTFR